MPRGRQIADANSILPLKYTTNDPHRMQTGQLDDRVAGSVKMEVVDDRQQFWTQKGRVCDLEKGVFMMRYIPRSLCRALPVIDRLENLFDEDFAGFCSVS